MEARVRYWIAVAGTDERPLDNHWRAQQARWRQDQRDGGCDVGVAQTPRTLRDHVGFLSLPRARSVVALGFG